MQVAMGRRERGLTRKRLPRCGRLVRSLNGRGRLFFSVKRYLLDHSSMCSWACSKALLLRLGYGYVCTCLLVGEVKHHNIMRFWMREERVSHVSGMIRQQVFHRYEARLAASECQLRPTSFAVFVQLDWISASAQNGRTLGWVSFQRRLCFATRLRLRVSNWWV